MVSKIKKLVLGIVVTLVILMAGSLVYLSIYYRADETALEVLSQVEVVEDGVLYLEPEEWRGEDKTGIIYYPGAKVEYTAYLPMMKRLQEEGIAVVLVEMPFNMAFFDISAADKVYDKIPEVDAWYIMGHSLGGAMASVYAQDNVDKIDGLITIGAYVYGEYPAEKAISIYGEYDKVLEQKFRDGDTVIMIPGGNHAQFGNYGDQKGDAQATITAEEQQEQAVEAIIEFIEK